MPHLALNTVLPQMMRLKYQIAIGALRPPAKTLRLDPSRSGRNSERSTRLFGLPPALASEQSCGTAQRQTTASSSGASEALFRHDIFTAGGLPGA